MSKVSISDVAQALKDSQIPAVTLRRILEQLNQKAEASKPSSAGPKAKQQHVILVSDPDGAIRHTTQLVGWVLQIEESASPVSVLSRISEAAASYHATKKGQLYPVKTVGEVLEGVPRKHWRSSDPDDTRKTLVKTKHPVLVVVTDNALSAINTQPRTA